MAPLSTTIEEAIARVEDWKGCDVSYSSVGGGVTNPNFKVKVDGKNFFLKIPGVGTDFINREVCHQANVLASESGAGPTFRYYFPDTAVEIVDWLDGYRTLTFGDVYNEKIFKMIFEKIRAFHNLPGAKLDLEQNVFDQAHDMINRVVENGSYLPAWHDKMVYLINACEDAIKTNGIDSKPCHNDFWTNNIMYNEETGDMKIIDFEYASMNDPYYDLGLCATCYFTDAMEEELCKVYHGGEFNPVGFAKEKIYKIAGDIKWSYWALYQSLTSDIEFDYMNWYGQKVARLQGNWNDPRLDMWLNLLNGKPVFRKF